MCLYPYESIDDLDKFHKTSLPEKQRFANADHAHAEKVSKDFEIKDLGEYHDFHVRSNTLL